MMKTGIYEHYKGKRYEVIGVAHHSETLEELVIYKALYHSSDFGSGALWVRPKQLFEEEIEVNGGKIKRFKYLEEIK